MTRLGFDYRNYENIYQYLIEHSHLKVKGIYSHFATYDEGDLSIRNQLKLFNEILEHGEKLGFKFKYIHCSNSGALLNLPLSLFNTVRVMLAYGISPSNEVEMNIDVEPVMSFCGPIVNERVKANTQVSYGGVYSTKKNTNIGVIQAGFADGFPRPWYENGCELQRDYFNIAGRVCMDQFMVDFGDIEPNLEDEVLILVKKIMMNYLLN